MRDFPDGTYDCIVVDVENEKESSPRVTFAITSGAHKGETLALRASSLSRDSIELLGLPATIIVRDGAPTVRW